MQKPQNKSSHKIEFPSEKFIEDYVMSCISDMGECPFTGVRADLSYSQVRLGAYGIADIVKINHDDELMQITVLELKNQPLKLKDLAQLGRYMKGVERIAERYSNRIKNCIEIEVLGELVGTIDHGSRELHHISGVLKNISIYGVELTMEDGFSSTNLSPEWEYHRPNIKLQPLVREVYDSARDTIQIFKDYDSANANTVVPISKAKGAS